MVFSSNVRKYWRKTWSVLKIRKSGIFIDQGKACVYIMSTFARANGVIIISNVRNTR